MRWLPVLGFVLSGCGSCGSGPAVPFGLDATPGAQADDREQPTAVGARPSEGRAFPPGTTRVEVEGAPIEERKPYPNAGRVALKPRELPGPVQVASGDAGAYTRAMADPVKPLPSDEDPDSVQQAWTEEIRRRVDKLRAGEAQFVDGDEALAQIRALIASHGG